MTKDEKAIWTAVFAARHETIAQTGECREDCVAAAIEEADYTILALRRVVSRTEKFKLHRIEPLVQEEGYGRGVDVPPEVRFSSVKSKLDD